MLSPDEVSEVLAKLECPDVCMMYNCVDYFQSCNFSQF